MRTGISPNTGHEHPEKYNDQYDAFYCDVCNVWLEKICSDETCNFCKNRPNAPLEQ